MNEAIRFFAAAFPDFDVRGRARAETPGNERGWLPFGNDTTYIALEEAKRKRAGHATYRNPGINHIGFVVGDPDSIIERLSDAGFTENMRNYSHPFRKRTYFYDTDGIEHEFIEYLTDKSKEKNQY